MDGTLAGRAGLDRRPACHSCCGQDRLDGRPPTGRGRNGCCATSSGGCSSSIRARARGATSRITTISTAGSIRCSSTPTGNTAAPISKRRTSRSTTPSSPRSAISRPSCCSTPRPTRARHRLRLGRACALPRRDLRRARHRHHAVAGTARAARGERAAEQSACRRGRVPPAGLSRRRRNSSTASSRSACSSMSASATTTRSSASAPSCSTTTA